MHCGRDDWGRSAMIGPGCDARFAVCACFLAFFSVRVGSLLLFALLFRGVLLLSGVYAAVSLFRYFVTISIRVKKEKKKR